MMMLDRNAIAELILHRHENFLLDEAEVDQVDGKTQARFALTIGEDDSLNRHYFMKSTPQGWVLLEPLYMELMALGAIIAQGKQPPGTVAFFSAITSFVKELPLLLGQTIRGQVTLKRSKGGFVSFGGELFNASGQRAASGSLMAFALHPGMQGGQDSKKMGIIPPSTMLHTIDKNELGWKHSSLLFADTIVDYTEHHIVTSYTYPADHPLTRGHFPANPIMMGVTQWMALGDALWAYVLKRYGGSPSEPLLLRCSGEIVREDATLIAEIEDCLCAVDTQGLIDIVQTKKVAFRDMVRPNEKIIVSLRLHQDDA
jgi:3-hydroxymyristoyl/3-hydroxydecanoyl-(acyl carrier protein) dehydratase